MATGSLDPPPYAAPLTIQDESFVSGDWTRWYGELFDTVGASLVQVGSTLNLTNQGAAIAPTALSLPAIWNGPYRLTGYLQVTTPDGVASSVGLVFGWTKNGIALTKTFTALAGNAVTTADSFSIEVPTDQSTPLLYSTSYSSTTPGMMKYLLTITVVKI